MADAKARPGLPRDVWISDNEFLPLPPRAVNYALGGLSGNDLLAEQYAMDLSEQLLTACPTTLLTFDA